MEGADAALENVRTACRTRRPGGWDMVNSQTEQARKYRRLVRMGLATGGALWAACSPGLAAAATTTCDQLQKRPLANIDVLAARTVVGSLPVQDQVNGRGAAASRVDHNLTDLPEFCRVNAILKPAPASRIEIEVWLPKDWNGKLLGIGSHGFAGNFERGDMAMALHRGYAVATSDTGHTKPSAETQASFNVGDASFAVGNEAAVDDFAWRATHEMTVAAKTLVRRFYGKAPRRSYFDGCSNGGRQAMREAQQFPNDYDGILAGSAAMNWTRAIAATVSYFQAGILPSGAKISAAKLGVAQRGAIAACDRLDGLADGLISDPQRCNWRPAALICRPGQEPAACLTAEEAAALDKVRSPINDPRTGAFLYDGLVPGGEALSRNMIDLNRVTANFYRYMVLGDANWTPDAGTDVFALLAKSEQAGSPGTRINSMNPDLSAFRARGGKLIQYHGWSDPSFGPVDAARYYVDVVDAQPGGDKQARTESFYRLFMAPGMAHCYGGQGPVNFGALDHHPAPLLDADHDILEALDRWVEKGIAPKQIIATEFTDDGKVKRQMPICTYPKVAIYTGGDIDRPESFSCTAPGAAKSAANA